MITVTSISGGKTSAYLAANYKTDYNVFALVRTNDKSCKWNGSKKTIQEVEDRIQKPFIGTLEDDQIIYTILELEQFIGRKIEWVTGKTFDKIVERGFLPSKLHRFCTTEMKIKPIQKWWFENFDQEPMLTNIGFRASEVSRANKSLEKCIDGYMVDKFGIGHSIATKRRKLKSLKWQKPNFPLIQDQIYREHIDKYWKGKPVNFAEFNNCVGCFHQDPLKLNYRWKTDRRKIEWFAKQEKPNKNRWNDKFSYSEICKENNLTNQLTIDIIGSCDSGYCGL